MKSGTVANQLKRFFSELVPQSVAAVTTQHSFSGICLSKTGARGPYGKGHEGGRHQPSGHNETDI